MRRTFIIVLLLVSFSALSQSQRIKIAKVKYHGGGDWYANKTALPNLAKFCNQHLRTQIDIHDDIVEIGSPDLFLYPFIYLTGHGNVVFSDDEAENLRNYLIAGGFLHIDDNYGLDPFVRLEMKKVFPELDFIEIPFDHDVYHAKFDFKNGLPKVHEHDGKPAQGFGIFYEGRLVCFYSYECDLGNGWEDQIIHGNSEATRRKALQMGANLITYAFTQY